jgi:hypothetical protein
MRRLKYIPIIHTGVEMGSMYGTLKGEYIKRFGTQRWEEHNNIIEDFWQGIRNKVFELDLDYPRTRLYQDGLPVCGKEMDLVEELVKKGSPNHQILMELIHLGARLEGTEDPKLLLEEYHFLKNGIVDPKNQQMRRRYQQSANKILQKRDSYIAQRINETLREGETGLLFIGIAHRVDKRLSKDIGIDYIIYRLPFKEGFLPYEKKGEGDS